ncbi:hypothetical protein LWM68_28015 [Niabella sp. W65]|jgi:uncharacterized Tic20 family protein|nr:hypothetical protein [Niabella sp. W65]MCH7366280.1 hypothetical protein [Niabella sp. W65]ULT42002.1 hypothetical protein KRR40_46955 [Niabella sp. I65]
MFQVLLFLHSLFRWLVLVSLVYSIYRAYRGYIQKRSFSKTDNALRHWTATIAHIQLMIGMVLYFKSPLIQHFWTHSGKVSAVKEVTFFSLVHIVLMLISIVIITIGSSLAKRKQEDSAVFKTMLAWYLPALILIIIAIPWPFSPLASRPYFR